MIIRAERPVPLYTMSMLVVKIFKENLQKAFHHIIAPAEKYTIFKNKSKRKLDMLPSQTAYPAGFETSTPD